MRLRTKFIVLVALLHAALLVLSFFIWRSQPVVFILAEIILIVSALLSWGLYHQLLRPLRMLREGIEAIGDKDFTVKFRPTGKVEMDQLIDVYNRMIDELRTERTRQEEQHFFLEKLIHTSPVGIVILDYDNQVQEINPQARSILSPALLSEVLSLEPGCVRVVKPGGVHTFKLQKSHFMDRGFPRHFVVIEELTLELLAAEKNTYGKVIRMMAHEVNNTVGPVNSIIQSVLGAGKLPEPLSEALAAAQTRNQHLNLFVRNFAELVKLPPPECKPLFLPVLLETVSRLMSILAGQRGVTLTVAADPLTVSADENLLEQALVNIVKNAIEAIEGPGSVSISLSGRRLVIADTGKGIVSADQPLLFSPFFSTKKDGQGIGLTLVREILTQHGWEFSLATVAPGRTEFTILF